MDELSGARAELALLEEQARRLLKELLRVRAAVATQRTKINELIRTRPTAFNLLPTEILLSILDFGVRAEHPKRKYELAGVCRRWRRGALLDIVIEASLWSQSQRLALAPCLNIVSSLAHRWHRLSIANVNDDEGESNDITLPEFIITRISHLQFPSLKYVAISFCDTSLAFLSPDRTPALEHLELNQFVTEHTDFPQLTALKTLKLDFYEMDYPSFPYLIPTQALTKLSISGFIEEFSLRPNSIHFPSLKILEISCPTITRQFMDAIMAPNLAQFKYSSSSSDDLSSVALGGFCSKFTSVRDLSFSCTKIRWTPELLYADAIALCEAFPGVRHVELSTSLLPHFFDPTLNNARARRPIDLWTELESLTFWGLRSKWLEPNQLSSWLADRQALGLRKLHVKLASLSEYGPGQGIDFKFPQLYKVLKENCNLELDNFLLSLTLPKTYINMPVDSQLRVVSTSLPYAAGAIFTVCLAFAASNNRTYG